MSLNQGEEPSDDCAALKQVDDPPGLDPQTSATCHTAMLRILGFPQKAASSPSDAVVAWRQTPAPM